MIVLLDTTVLIDVMRERNERRELLVELVRQNHVLATSAINHAELFAGYRPEEERRLERLLARLECYPVTSAIGRRAGRLKNASARRGRTFGLPDVLIAATAIEHDLTLLTDNRKHFSFPELKLYPLSS